VSPAGCPAFDATLSSFYARVRAAIGVTRKLILYEPNVLFNFGSASSARGGQVFSFHDYCLTAGVQGACDTFDDLVFKNAIDHAGDREVPFLTEFGATQDPTVLGPMTDRADSNMVGWQEWHYCGCADPTTSGPGDAQALVLDPAKAPRGANLETDKLALLARPYPRTVAGTPTAWSFTNGTAEAAWTTARASGHGRFGRGSVSELAVPRRQFPAGYRVAASGARVVSARGAVSLRVATCRGARTVEVSVKPGPGRSTRRCR
jgi:endoglycosylceramidase